MKIQVVWHKKLTCKKFKEMMKSLKDGQSDEYLAELAKEMLWKSVRLAASMYKEFRDAITGDAGEFFFQFYCSIILLRACQNMTNALYKTVTNNISRSAETGV